MRPLFPQSLVLLGALAGPALAELALAEPVHAEPAALAPGRYVVAPDAGDWIEVDREGQARAARWGATPRPAESLRLVRLHEPGPCVTGLGPEPVCLLPVAGPPPILADALPAAWQGTWIHRAPGGLVRLALAADGSATLAQHDAGAPEAPPVQANGRWARRGAALALSLGPGAELSYAVERTAEGLRLGGGDLPFAVLLSPEVPAEASPAPATPAAAP